MFFIHECSKTQKDSSITNMDHPLSVEERYIQLSLHDQILLRPSTQIGSVENDTSTTWVINDDEKIVKRPVTTTPGLIKIFDEVLINSTDNLQRSASMKYIKVTIDQKTGYISVTNDGKSIPIVEHQTQGCYVPQMIFGNLLSSSNYEDGMDEFAGGQNGVGVKLCNIFSSEFCIHILDGETKKSYTQKWSDNMKKMSDPVIRTNGSSRNQVKVTFRPDFARFGMSHGIIDDDTYALLAKRVYDIAATCPTLKVYLNGKVIKTQSFKKFVQLFFDQRTPVAYAKVNDHWEIAVTASQTGKFEHVSFVNKISTSSGGTHVEYIARQICDYIKERVKKKNKLSKVTSTSVKTQTFLFVNCLIKNPRFTSQSKEELTTKTRSFGSTCKLSTDFLNKIANTGLLSQVMDWSTTKTSIEAKRSDGRKRVRLVGVDKLEDANFAGGAKSSECSLILTEGDSAKALAMSGISVVGRDRYGVYPLRGKIQNVTNSTQSSVNASKTIDHLKKIIGLQTGKDYTDDISTLRYGSVILLCDADKDASHITALVLNLFKTQWLSLFKRPGFLKKFSTPIVSVKKGKSKPIYFFTEAEFHHWKEENNSALGYTVRYLKGLGSSTAKEGQEYFRNIDKNLVPFEYQDEKDEEKFSLVFDKRLADQRKAWLGHYVPKKNVQLVPTHPTIPFTKFIDEELILYSIASVARAVPSLVDGLKPSQRKVICSAIRHATRDIKVVELCGRTMALGYHHGDASLNGTIVGLAQDFVGSNNVPLLTPQGQFGSRAVGGKDASSARYIFTRLSPVTRYLFHPRDDSILNYLHDDGHVIEPDFYLPIIPTVLINQISGIGTAFSTSIPSYSPLDLITEIRNRLHDQNYQFSTLTPWFRGFTGKITSAKPNTYTMDCPVRISPNKRKISITELPIGKWTDAYKLHLEKMMESKKISQFSAYHTDNLISFIVSVTDAQYELLDAKKMTPFKLSSTIRTSNMMLFDQRGQIKKYDDVSEIIEQFYTVRLDAYHRRKDNMIDYLQKDLVQLSNRVRFILSVINEEVEIRHVRKEVLVSKLEELNFDKMDEKFDYLIGMQIWMLTYEKVEELKKKHQEKTQELKSLHETPVHQLWLDDLKDLELVMTQTLLSFENVLREELRMIPKKARESRSWPLYRVDDDQLVNAVSKKRSLERLSSTPKKKKKKHQLVSHKLI